MTRRTAPGLAASLALFGILAFPTVAAPPGASELRETVDALLAALRAGDAAAYERLATERFAPALLARRTPEQRKQFVLRFHGDFGAFEVTQELFDAWSAEVGIRPGKSGEDVTATLRITLDPHPPHRVTDLAVAVEKGGGDRAPRTRLEPLPPLAGVADPERFAAMLDPYLSKMAADGALSGVVLVARKGKPVYQRAFGLADRERGVPNALDTRFNLASIGKQFTQVAVGQLLQQGKLTLDDPVARHLPAYPNADAARKMTVRQLVEHKAGVVDIFDVVKEGDAPPRSNREWFARVAPRPLEFEPGTKTRYCNGCYVVLGELVAALSGVPYEEYLARNVFAPAGIGAAFLAGSDPGPKQAVGYTSERGALEPASLGPGGKGSGAGGVFATAADLLAYEQALRSGRLLDRARAIWVLGGEDPAAAGLSVAGGAPGTNTLLSSDGTWTVVVLTNRDPRVGEDLGTALAKALKG